MATTTTPELERLVSGYGLDWTPGIISEHAHLIEAAGGTLRSSASGRRVHVVAQDGRVVAPLVCSELVSIPTEDGPVTGRCGIPVHGDEWACEGHAAEIAGWRSLSEPEKAAWERRHDEDSW